jgi:hypothetical protein
LLLMAVEEAFKNLKSLPLRKQQGQSGAPAVFHQLEARIEAHVFIAYLAYCLHITLARRLHALAPGLTPRNVLEKFAGMQMIDVHLPTTDGRELVLTRYTEPEPELSLLLKAAAEALFGKTTRPPFGSRPAGVLDFSAEVEEKWGRAIRGKFLKKQQP